MIDVREYIGCASKRGIDTSAESGSTLSHIANSVGACPWQTGPIAAATIQRIRERVDRAVTGTIEIGGAVAWIDGTNSIKTELSRVAGTPTAETVFRVTEHVSFTSIHGVAVTILIAGIADADLTDPILTDRRMTMRKRTRTPTSTTTLYVASQIRFTAIRRIVIAIPKPGETRTQCTLSLFAAGECICELTRSVAHVAVRRAFAERYTFVVA
jgi:hypothetical protein